jgi:2-oxoisovalerate dehydrogenase E2 component (dihydrolipoyl transacylase)
MGQFLFRLPDIGEGIAEAEIVAWHVKPGDRVREDDPLLDVMTDKATVDMSSPVDGVVVALHGNVGAMAPVGSVLVEMEVGETDQQPQREPKSELDSRPTEPPALAVPTVQQPSPVSSPSHSKASIGKGVNPDPSASPSTRRRAMEWGIDLHNVPGTGRNGIVTVEDLQRHRAAPSRDARVERTEVEELPVVGLRRRIAERMAESKRHIPHFTYVEEFDLTELENLRATLNADRGDRPKLTLLPFFMRAVVKLVPAFPSVNAHYDETRGMLKRFAAVDIGIATQTPQGLMVPVVRHAEARDLWDCAREMARVTTAAREAKASREELSGSSITLTSLGPLGGVAATPIINHPEVAILGPNKLLEKPVVDGAFLTKRKVLNLSASFDHRIIDGHDAASFVRALRRLIEHPALIFMD